MNAKQEKTGNNRAGDDANVMFEAWPKNRIHGVDVLEGEMTVDDYF